MLRPRFPDWLSADRHVQVQSSTADEPITLTLTPTRQMINNPDVSSFNNAVFSNFNPRKEIRKVQMLGHKFKACIWKTYRARRASKILTILEIIFPVVLFGVLSFIHFTDLKKFGQGKYQNETYEGESYNMGNLVRRGFEKREHIDIVYTSPTNNSNRIINNVLDNVFRKYKMEHKIRTFQALPTDIKVVSWLTTKYFNEDTSNTAKSVGFGFVFKNEEQPQEDRSEINLQYKIFCTLSTIKTDIIFPYYIQQGRGSSGDAYITSGIAALQWHIEKAMIEIVLLGQALPYDVELHSFPYPKGVDEGINEFMYITILLPLFTMMSFIFFIPVVIRRVVQEKASGVKELMRIMGLNSWYIWSTWLINCTIVFVITTLLTTIVLVLPVFGNTAFLDYVDFTVLWVMFFLFCVSSVIFCFFVTAFFNSPVTAMSCGVILWIGTFTLLNQLISSLKVPWLVKLIVCLFPTAVITTGFNILDFYDNRNEKLTWSKIFEDHSESKQHFNMAGVFLLFFLDMALFSIITWYFDRVKPGPFGIARPWNFLCKPKRLIRKFYKTNVNHKEPHGMYEEPSPYLKVGIYISDLRKVYKDDVIGLDGVSMNLYKNVITVLLGHNGAGKTSLMGIISGLHSPTSGNVIVGGEDIFSNMKKFHRNLGICFQYNYLFDYLNVSEHFIFFGMVKGMTFEKAQKEGMVLMKELNLLENKFSMIRTMSGGLLRRLSLAIALIGAPKVLLLDEPTCGLDPETRRDVWDLILRKRGSHTILITTQFMEEADVLGDWIAIMDHGKIVCYGTTPFLKKVYGTGYHLTIAKGKGFNVEAVTSVIKESVPQCTIDSNIATQMKCTLPLESTDMFPKMFTVLEDNKMQLGISALNLQCTTIEEVFLRVGEILQGPKSVSFTGFLLANLPKTMGFKDNLKGSALHLQQFKALFIKTLIFDLRNLLLLLFMALIPVAVVLIAYPSNTNFKNSRGQPLLKVDLSMYSKTTVFYSNKGHKNPDLVKKFEEKYQLLVESQQGKVVLTDNVTQALLKFGDHNAIQFRMQTIVSTAFNGPNIQAYFNNIPLHSVPISINLVTNTLLKYLFPTRDVSITFTYVPIDVTDSDDSCAQVSLGRGDSVGHQWAISMPQCLLCVMTVFLLLPAVERSSNCKHLQLMTGVPPLIYWVACFLWDYFLYSLVTLVLIITIIFSDKHNIFSSSQAIGILVLILMLYGISGTFYAYFSSNFGSLASRIIGNYLVFSICFGMISAILVNVATRREYEGSGIIPYALLQLLTYILPLCPHYCLVSCFIRYGAGTYQNSLCKNCASHICQEEQLLVMNSKKHPYGILLELVYLALVWILYLVLLIIVDNNKFHNMFWKVKDSRMNFEFDESDAIVSSDVHREKEKTLACSKDRSVDPKAIFLCVGLGKVYSKNSKILQPMSFRVRKGECFGLLGTNGAGKSTTFKLLVGDVRPTVGDAVNVNYTLMRNRTKYLSRIGYCPQMGALNLSFTGEETLRLYAQLRGVHPRRVETEVDNWIRLLGLTDYRSQVSGTYSSGTLRKLSTAVALIGHPPVVFLDEPTAGVDPFGRRNLWDVLNASKDHGQVVMLTSHSMQECEALCTRLTIVVKGKMVCLGSTQYLKKKFGQGYTVAVILHPKPELQAMIPLLKSDLQKFFRRVKLKDEHKRLLHYHIKDENIRFSQLFGVMEELKQLYPVIDSYTLGDTTLEQVFISFAKSHIQPEIIL